MNRKIPMLECSSCKGTGQVPIPEHFCEILKILSGRKVATAEMIRSKLSDEITVGGVTNRLADMKKAGLVTRVRKGKFYHYSLV